MLARKLYTAPNAFTALPTGSKPLGIVSLHNASVWNTTAFSMVW